MKISIITPTIRENGLKIVKQALDKQTFKNFEWLIGSSFNPKLENTKWIKDDIAGGVWSLNRITNKLIEQANGEIIITLEDWIYINPDAIEKFMINLAKLGRKNVISGVGDQYKSVNKYGKPQIKIWNDPRRTEKYGSFYECFFNDIEYNLAAFWKEDFIEIGGCDKELDIIGSGVALYQCSDRWNDLGFKFWLDQTNESFTVRHGREDYGGQKEWDKNHVMFNGEYDKRKKELKHTGNWPINKN